MIFLLLGDGLFPRFIAADADDDDDDDDADEVFVFSCVSDIRDTGVVATA